MQINSGFRQKENGEYNDIYFKPCLCLASCHYLWRYNYFREIRMLALSQVRKNASFI